MANPTTMNVLFATTTRWNPGDDFIRLGCLVALEAASGQRVHATVWDRNRRLDRQSTGRDNTQANVLCDGDTLAGFDLLAIAGTPAWGRPTDPLYKRALAIGLPMVHLGLGAESAEHAHRHLSPLTAAALQQSALITTRDAVTHAFLTSRGIANHLLPCPACLAPLYLYPAGIPAPVPSSTAIVSSDVPEIQAEALAALPQHPGSTLLAATSHERHTLITTGHRPVHESCPMRFLQLLLCYQHVLSGRLHAALPVLAAGGGRTTALLPSVSPRITTAHTHARHWFTTHTLHHLGARYQTLLRQALHLPALSPP